MKNIYRLLVSISLSLSLATAAEANRTVSQSMATLLQAIASDEPPAALERINAYKGTGHPLLTLATAQTHWRLAIATTDETTHRQHREAAERLFTEALQSDPTLRQAHLGLAQCASARKDWVIASREAALGVDATYGNRQEVSFLAQAALNAQDWRLASIAAQQGILRFPSDYELRRVELAVLMNANRFDDARQAVWALLDTTPNDANLWKQLAYIGQQSEHHDEALAALEAALLLQPQDHALRRSLADRQLGRNMPLAAFTTLSPLMTKPLSAMVIADTGLINTACRAAADSGDVAQARAWLAEIPTSQRTRDLHILSARLAIQANDEKDAAAALDVLIATGEKDPSILAWAGSLAQRRGDLPTAELLYITASSKDSPAAAAASLRLIALYLSQNRLEDARVTLATHLIKYPTDQQAKAFQTQLDQPAPQ
jgi:tetratricopeptide (TPR) repeat protein